MWIQTGHQYISCQCQPVPLREFIILDFRSVFCDCHRDPRPAPSGRRRTDLVQSVADAEADGRRPALCCKWTQLEQVDSWGPSIRNQLTPCGLDEESSLTAAHHHLLFHPRVILHDTRTHTASWLDLQLTTVYCHQPCYQENHISHQPERPKLVLTGIQTWAEGLRRHQKH